MTNYKPEKFRTITPYLCMQDVAGFLKFAQEGLGAEVVSKMGDDKEVHHAEFKFDDSMVMAGEVKDAAQATPAMLYFYVPNCDESYKKALSAGAESVMEPKDQFYGDRNAAVRDRWGNQWWFATLKETVSDEEIAKRAKENR